MPREVHHNNMPTTPENSDLLEDLHPRVATPAQVAERDRNNRIKKNQHSAIIYRRKLQPSTTSLMESFRIVFEKEPRVQHNQGGASQLVADTPVQAREAESVTTGDADAERIMMQGDGSGGRAAQQSGQTRSAGEEPLHQARQQARQQGKLVSSFVVHVSDFVAHLNAGAILCSRALKRAPLELEQIGIDFFTNRDTRNMAAKMEKRVRAFEAAAKGDAAWGGGRKMLAYFSTPDRTGQSLVRWRNAWQVSSDPVWTTKPGYDNNHAVLLSIVQHHTTRPTHQGAHREKEIVRELDLLLKEFQNARNETFAWFEKQKLPPTKVSIRDEERWRQFGYLADDPDAIPAQAAYTEQAAQAAQAAQAVQAVQAVQ